MDQRTQFQAMASPCLVLVDSDDAALGEELGAIARAEAIRIEEKYSRYRASVVTNINAAAGRSIQVDAETADLLDYANHCHALSAGLFDITSGVLRKVWKFDRTANIPSPAAVEEVLANVGWQRVIWKRPSLQLAAGMEIDFGGIGKEYAVDRALTLIKQRSSAPALVNLGGDLRVTGPRRDGSPWRVGIEDIDHDGSSAGLLALEHGALATSGDSHRFLLRDGRRYGHVLNPITGWPTCDAPRSVTVHANTCTEAGLLAKLALLRGKDAESFLHDEQVRAWCAR
jgi:thiamine biosynthesis lipoprotein